MLADFSGDFEVTAKLSKSQNEIIRDLMELHAPLISVIRCMVVIKLHPDYFKGVFLSSRHNNQIRLV